MNTTITKKALMLAAIAALGIGATSAMARGGWGPGHCMGYDGMPQARMNGGGPDAAWQGNADFAAARTARIEQYLAWLKPTLNLRADQTAAWDSFSGFVVEHARERATQMQEAWQAGAPTNAVERLARREQHLQAMETSLAAMKTEVTQFYQQLDPQQQQLFDANFTMGNGPGGPGGFHGPRHGGHRGGWR